MRIALALIPLFLSAVACETSKPVALPVASGADAAGFTAPSEHTLRANQAAGSQLDLDDPADFEAATGGRI